MSQDPIDTFDEIAEETAQEVAVKSEELSQEIEESLANTDGDPCHRKGSYYHVTGT